MIGKYVKRLFDILLSVIMIIILLPIFLLVGFFIKWETKGPILFKQKRLGYQGNPFLIYKFRTMKHDLSNPGAKSTDRNDQRITKVGKVLRKTSVDEIPQFFNILLGQMSIIGPRPRIYKENLDTEELYRLKMRPGITGLAQVYGRSMLSIDKRLELDIFYIRNFSFWLDVKVFFKTIKIVLLGKNSY